MPAKYDRTRHGPISVDPYGGQFKATSRSTGLAAWGDTEEGAANKLAALIEQEADRPTRPRDSKLDRAARSLDTVRDASDPRQRDAGGVRTVYNKLLGGWYNVTGPYQSPIGGRYSSKEEAQAALRAGQERRDQQEQERFNKIAGRDAREKRFRVSNEDGDSYVIEARDLREAQQIAREQEGSRRHTVYEEGDRGPGWGRPRFRDARARATDPPVSEAQRRAMGAAMSGKSNLGIPRSVGKEFINADPGGHLPATAKDGYRVRAKVGSVELLENDAYTPSKWFVKGPTGIEEYRDEQEARSEFKSLAQEYGRRDAGGPAAKDQAIISIKREGDKWRVKYHIGLGTEEMTFPASSNETEADARRYAERKLEQQYGGRDADNRKDRAKKLAESEGFRWDDLSRQEQGVFLGRIMDLEEEEERRRGAHDAALSRGDFVVEKRTGKVGKVLEARAGYVHVKFNDGSESDDLSPDEVQRMDERGRSRDAYADPAKYAPYHKMPAFQEGVRAYKVGNYRNPYNPNSVEAQAWDRGLEYGKTLQWEEENVGNRDCPLDLAADAVARAGDEVGDILLKGKTRPIEGKIQALGGEYDRDRGGWVIPASNASEAKSLASRTYGVMWLTVRDSAYDLYDPRVEGRSYRITYGGGKVAYVVAPDPRAAARAFRLEHDEPIEGLRDLGVGGGSKDRRLGRAADALRAVRAHDTRIERDLRDDQPRIVSGVMGMKSKPFQKKFRNQAEMERWMDSDAAAGNVDIYEIRAADALRARDVKKPQRPNPPTAEPLRPHPSRIAPPTQVSGFARGVSGLGDPVYRSGAVPDSVSAWEQWDGARRRINY